ncbi:golgin-45 [Pectinophora gossypiella]|uniref:Golgin-45 n=2 Tax=Pectinophora gossypiella TaxID=13191 RepID=A0A1E1WKL5_PECGO|nr:golgin-45 [Pectinophora gossypiella]
MDKLTPFHLKIMNKRRTAGDGMESDEKTVEVDKKVISKPGSRSTSKESLIPGRLVQVFPTSIVRPQKKHPHIHSKTPKFVPYEPYPAAVKPITPKTVSKSVKKSKNNMDINTLITQMSQMNTNLSEFKPRAKLMSTGDNSNKSVTDNDKTNAVNQEMQKKIDELVKENDSLKEQLKQQVQVNKELKTMLVASMGEDLETQVQSLNEDKKHLANALLNSAQHLSTHQEQTEWLAGQCEVWRSKFLASSLMVEELADCKKQLNEKTENLQQAIRQLLDERCRSRDMMLCTYKNLYSLHEKWLENITISQYTGNNMYNRPIGNLNFSATMPHSTNILDMSSVNLKLSENISNSVEKQDISHLNSLPTLTDGEVHAENVMAMPLEVKRVNEEPVNALVHHAYSNSGNSPRPVASCVHCNGKVQLL